MVYMDLPGKERLDVDVRWKESVGVENDRKKFVGGEVICSMRAPLEGNESLMPDQMDMDRIRCLFETCMELRAPFASGRFVVVYTSKYQLEE